MNKTTETKPFHKATTEKTREFGNPVKNLKYTKGNWIHHETGHGNLLEPAREAKLFEMAVSEDPKVTCRNFVKRVGKFAVACLNRRCNGTIYFGVGDSKPVKKDQREFIHCEIVGMNITYDQVEHFEDAVKFYLRGMDATCFKNISNPEMKNAVNMCISPIRIVPIHNSTNIILEIDIEPSSNRCRHLVFQIQLPQDEKKFLAATRCRLTSYQQNAYQLPAEGLAATSRK